MRRKLTTLRRIAGEEWKPLPGATGYAVSSHGRVALEGKGLPEYVNAYGRKRANVKMDAGYRTTIFVARAVAELFMPGFIPENVICHRNGNRRDCRLTNLYQKTRSEVTVAPKGAARCTAKLTEADVIAIRASGEHPSVLAERYGVSKTHIFTVRGGRSWGHLPLPPNCKPCKPRA